MHITIIYNEQKIFEVIDHLKLALVTNSVIAFIGPLGAGKTTLIRELLKSLGVTQLVTSPTFTYVNAYSNEINQTFYHFDLYRLNSLDQFLQAGFDEYLYTPNSWAFIEWPEIIMPLLKDRVCFCTIEYHNQERKITIKS